MAEISSEAGRANRFQCLREKSSELRQLLGAGATTVLGAGAKMFPGVGGRMLLCGGRNATCLAQFASKAPANIKSITGGPISPRHIRIAPRGFIKTAIFWGHKSPRRQHAAAGGRLGPAIAVNGKPG